MKLTKSLMLLLAMATLVASCGVHYPSIGVMNGRVRATDWKGRRIAPECIERATRKRHMTVRCNRLYFESR